MRIRQWPAMLGDSCRRSAVSLAMRQVDDVAKADDGRAAADLYKFPFTDKREKGLPGPPPMMMLTPQSDKRSMATFRHAAARVK